MTWAAVAALERCMPAFAGLGTSLVACGDQWQAWTAAFPLAVELPGGWGGALTAFQHVLLVKVLAAYLSVKLLSKSAVDLLDERTLTLQSTSVVLYALFSL